MFTVQVSSAKFCSVSLFLLLLKSIFLGGLDTEFDYNEVFILVFYHLFHITQISQEQKVFENLGTRNLIPYVPSFFTADDVWLINNERLSKLYIIPPLSSLLNTSLTLIWLTHSFFRRKFRNYDCNIFFSTANRILSHPNILSNYFCGDVKLDCILLVKRWHWKQNGFRNHHNSNHYVPSWIS